MNKYNKKNNTIQESVKSIPKLIKDKRAYSLLISNRGISFRKMMAERLDNLIIPKAGWKTWKSRFLYPAENIPKKSAKEISTAMEEMIIWALQQQVDYLTTKKKEIDELINKSLEIINSHKNQP